MSALVLFIVEYGLNKKSAIELSKCPSGPASETTRQDSRLNRIFVPCKVMLKCVTNLIRFSIIGPLFLTMFLECKLCSLCVQISHCFFSFDCWHNFFSFDCWHNFFSFDCWHTTFLVLTADTQILYFWLLTHNFFSFDCWQATSLLLTADTQLL